MARLKYRSKPLWYCRNCGCIVTNRPAKRRCASCGASPMAYFASQREYAKFTEVERLMAASGGSVVELQPAFPIVVCGVKVANPYRADFAFTDANGVRRIVDVKGVDTREGRLRRKLAEVIHGITVEVWK